MSIHPEALALLLADARLPVAGHTQSAGLEPALADGVLPVQAPEFAAGFVPEFLRLRLRTVVRTEAATAVVARAAVLAGEPLEPVVDAWSARTPSAAMRHTSRTLGRALARLAPRLVPNPEALAAVPAQPPRPVVFGAIAALAGVDAAATARIVAYDDVQTVASAALKLLPLDPAEATAWVVDAFPLIDAVVVAATAATAPSLIPARSAPLLEQHAERHAHTTRRLFSA